MCTVSVTLQFGHSSVAAHWRQNTAVAKPRRLSRINDCSPRSRRSLHRRHERPAQHHVVARLGNLLAHVDHAARWAIGRSSTRVVERHQRVAAGEGVAYDSSVGVADPMHDQRSGELAAHDRHIAPVIARRLVLLVRGVVLLIHDDEAGIGERRKHRRARADHDVDVAAADAVPLIVALAIGEAAVLNRDRVAERARNSAATCGVSAISGTSISTPRPLLRTASASRRYTSVLPLPVTPWISAT